MNAAQFGLSNLHSFVIRNSALDKYCYSPVTAAVRSLSVCAAVPPTWDVYVLCLPGIDNIVVVQ